MNLCYSHSCQTWSCISTKQNTLPYLTTMPSQIEIGARWLIGGTDAVASSTRTRCHRNTNNTSCVAAGQPSILVVAALTEPPSSTSFRLPIGCLAHPRQRLHRAVTTSPCRLLDVCVHFWLRRQASIDGRLISVPTPHATRSQLFHVLVDRRRQRSETYVRSPTAVDFSVHL